MRNWLVGVGAASVTIIGHVGTAAAASSSNSLLNVNPLYKMLQIFAWLIVVIILAVLFIKFLARYNRVESKGEIRVLAARQVAPNRSIQVIEVKGRHFLIGVGDQVTLLTEMTDASGAMDAFESPSQTGVRSFGQVLADSLASARKRYRSSPLPKEESEN